MPALELENTPLRSDENLKGYFRFEGNSTDEITEETGNDTDINYGESYGKFNSGVHFNTDRTSKIVLTNNEDWISDTMSFSFWLVKKPDNNSNDQCIYARTRNDANVEPQLGFGFGMMWDSNNYFSVIADNYEGVGEQKPVGSLKLSDLNDGDFIVLVLNWPKARVYVNGELAGESDDFTLHFNLNNYSNNVSIGCNNCSVSGYFLDDCNIDDFAIFNRVLTESEIVKLYNGNFEEIYPNYIYEPRTKENAPGIVYDETKTKNLYAEDIVKLDQNVVAIQNTLGINPQGSYETVLARLDRMQAEIDALK